MPQYSSYSQLTTPADGDLVGIIDVSASNEFKYITLVDLHTTSQIKSHSSGDLQLTDNSDNIGVVIKDGGNIGIGSSTVSVGDYMGGVASPYMHIKDTTGTGDYFLTARFQAGVDADDTGSAILINHANDRGLLIKAGRGTGDNGIAYFAISSAGGIITDVMTLTQAGQVGIGTTSPSQKLDVNGDVIFEDTNSITFDSSVPAIISNDVLRINQSNNIDVHIGTNSLFVDTSAGSVGIGTSSPSANLDIRGTGDIIQIYATSGSSRIKFSNAGSNLAYIVNATSTISIGSATTAGATTLNLSKSTGKVNVGGTDFSRQLTVTSSDSVISNLTSSAASKCILLIETTNNSSNRNQAIGFRYNNSGTQNVTWVAGSKGSASAGTSYFVIHAPSSSLDDDATINFESTLSSNDVYIDQSGTISSANTSPAYVEVTGGGTPSITGSNNVTSVTSSGSEFTITFTKEMNNTNYAVFVSGYNSNTGAVITGFPTTKNAASCVIQLAPSSADATSSDTKVTIMVMGAKLTT